MSNRTKILFNQTSAGFDSTVLANGTGWYGLDINSNPDTNRSYMGQKNTADTISLIGKLEASQFNSVNPANSVIVTVECTLASYGAGITSFSDSMTSPLTAIRVQKTGAVGVATVILLG